MSEITRFFVLSLVVKIYFVLLKKTGSERCQTENTFIHLDSRAKTQEIYFISYHFQVEIPNSKNMVLSL